MSGDTYTAAITSPTFGPVSAALTVTLAVLARVLACISIIDARARRIPNRLVVLAVVVAAAGLATHAVVTGTADDAVRAVTAAAAAGAVYLAL